MLNEIISFFENNPTFTNAFSTVACVVLSIMLTSTFSKTKLQKEMKFKNGVNTIEKVLTPTRKFKKPTGNIDKIPIEHIIKYTQQIYSIFRDNYFLIPKYIFDKSENLKRIILQYRQVNNKKLEEKLEKKIRKSFTKINELIDTYEKILRKNNGYTTSGFLEKLDYITGSSKATIVLIILLFFVWIGAIIQAQSEENMNLLAILTLIPLILLILYPFISIAGTIKKHYSNWKINSLIEENKDENLTWTIEKELKIKTITVRKKQK